MPTYDLPPLSYEVQLAQLEGRGLEIDRRREGLELLATIGYTRLSSYWKHRLLPESDEFEPGASLSDIYERYQFDSRLRLLTLYAVNHVEIALRSALVYHMSHELGTGLWVADYSVFRDPLRQSRFVSKVVTSLKTSTESWAKKYKHVYQSSSPVPPAWIALQFASFGDLVDIYRNTVHMNVRHGVCGRYELPHDVFLSWIKTLHKLRNACAHHSRTWNRNLAAAPAWPRQLARRADRWVSSWEPADAITDTDFGQHRNLGSVPSQGLTYYSAACVMKYMLDCINPRNTFKQRLGQCIRPHVDAGHPVDIEAGFPRGWEAEPLWTYAPAARPSLGG